MRGTDYDALFSGRRDLGPGSPKFGARADFPRRRRRTRREPAAGPGKKAPAPEGGWKPLTKKQKRILSQLARRAHVRTGAAAAGDNVDEWRRAQAVEVCTRRISEARQQDYLLLHAHFADLAGESGVAFESLMRVSTNDKRVALYKLGEALRGAELPESYAAAICRHQFRCEISQAGAKQVWNLVYTIRNRGQSRRRKETRRADKPQK
jgi:hypothetical protein